MFEIIAANPLQPIIDGSDDDPEVLGRGRLRRRREQLGLRDHPAHLHDPAADPAAHLQVGEVDAEAPGAPAGDEEDPGALQGRHAAHEPGDDEVLPGEQGQSPGLLPPAAASDPVLHLALLPAARATSSRRTSRGTRASSSSPISPQTAHRRAADPRVHDRALRRHAADRLGDHDGRRRQDPAADHVRAAVRLHDLHRQLRGRPDRLLDHHQRVDDRPAARGAQALPEAAGPGGDRATPRVVDDDGNGGKPARGKPAAASPATPATARRRRKPPPGSPRKKKKRSGRRR